MSKKIKEFLGTRVEYDKEGGMIWGISEDDGMQRVADVRGWGAININHILQSKIILQ